MLYDECTEEQQLYAWWMECPGGVCEYVEEFAFGASLVWCRIANMWSVSQFYTHPCIDDRPQHFYCRISGNSANS